MKKGILTEDEFNKLPEQSQLGYRFCVNCNLFYFHIQGVPHVCCSEDVIKIVEQTMVKEV